MGLLEPRNLRVSDEWYTRFRVSWDPPAARVNGYKLVYTPVGKRKLCVKLTKLSSESLWIILLHILWLNAVPGTDNTMEVFVGDVTTHILQNLQPGTTYDLKVYAQYDAGVSGALTGQGTTCTCLIL